MTVLEKSIKLNLGNVLCVLKLIILHYDFNFDSYNYNRYENKAN